MKFAQQTHLCFVQCSLGARAQLHNHVLGCRNNGNQRPTDKDRGRHKAHSALPQRGYTRESDRGYNRLLLVFYCRAYRARVSSVTAKEETFLTGSLYQVSPISQIPNPGRRVPRASCACGMPIIDSLVVAQNSPRFYNYYYCYG